MTSPAQTLASHLISQTLASITALENASIITQDDAQAIRSRLPNPYASFPHLSGTPAVQAPPQQHQVLPPAAPLNFTPPPAPQNFTPPAYSAPTPVPPPPPPAPTPNYGAPAASRARALWGYESTDPGDLKFQAGDIIIIDEEVNAEWFRGRVEGRSIEKGGAGLFPSNYVEKLGGPGLAPPPPPPQQQQYQYQQQPPPQEPQPAPAQEGQHKHNYGKLGSKLGSSAVHGFGFGAGASVANNIVNSIF